MIFKERKILVTGASSGLGKILSIHFNNKVKTLVCIGKNSRKINLLKRKLKNKNNLYFAGDITKEKKLKKLFYFLNKIKNIDTVIHCMGGGLGIKKDLLPKKDFIKLMMVNLIGQSEINNFLIKKMIKKKIKGNILHISSIAGIESIASIGYSSMKAALIAYSKKLGKSFLNKNIFVKTLIPGAFETKDNSFGRLKTLNYKAYKDFKKNKLIRKKFAKADKFIPIVEFMIAKDSEILSGTDVVADYSESNSFRI